MVVEVEAEAEAEEVKEEVMEVDVLVAEEAEVMGEEMVE